MLLTADMKRVVDEQKLGFVATVNADGTPNLSPKGTMQVLDDEHIVFAEIRSPGTMANIARQPAMEINFAPPAEYVDLAAKTKAFVIDKVIPYENDPRWTSHAPTDALRRACRRSWMRLATSPVAGTRCTLNCM